MFGPNYKFIGKSSITTGAVKDVKPFNIEDKTYKNWFIRSLEFFKKNIHMHRGIRFYKNN